MNKLGFYLKNDHVRTPRDFYDSLDSVHHFDFDPCPYQSALDGLMVPWGKSNFVNPPYSMIKKFLQKGVSEMKEGRKSIFLIPIRSNSNYWQQLVLPFCTDFRFLKGMNFEGYTREMPVPLCLVTFDPEMEPVFRPGIIGTRTSWEMA